MRIGKTLRQIRRTGLLLTALSLVSLAPAASVRTHREGSAEAEAASRFGQLPLSFEENRGQTDQSVRYLSRGTGYTLFLTGKDAVLSLTSVEGDRKSRSTSIRLGFAGSRGASAVNASDLQGGVSNYFSGRDQAKWLKGLKHYGRVNYSSLYPGVDAVFYGNQRQLEYDFVIAPNADPKQIRLTFDGLKGVRVNEAGELVLRTALGELVQGRPVAYQTIDGKRVPVEAKYAVRGNEVAFTLARYDRSKTLVIDPTLQWSTYFGGAGLDYANGIAVDPSRNVYFAGYTTGGGFPTSSRFGGVLGGSGDAYVVKLAADGRSVLWSTFIAGEGNDQANAVAADASGVTVAGFTDSLQFPLVANPQTVYGGGSGDGFVLKISSAGDQLVYSTYLGGNNFDYATDVALDSKGGPVVVGATLSTNFPLTGPVNGGSDAFIARLVPEGSSFVYRIVIGSAGTEVANGVAVDSSDNAYMTGRTNSALFQGTPGVVQPTLKNTHLQATDAFVAKITPAGGTAWRTLLGGGGNDEGISIDVDTAGNSYVFGNTDSGNFPLVNALRGSLSGSNDTFVAKLDPNAANLVYSTYLGGSGVETADTIRVNRTTGVAWLAGTTSSTDFPVSVPVQQALAGSTDIFVVELSATGSVNSSSYLGGAGGETAGGLAVDTAGNMYLTGSTGSTNFPVSANTLQAALSGVQDAFVTKLSNCTVALAPTVAANTPGANLSFAGQTGTITVTGSADCSWNALSSDTSWLTVTNGGSGSGNGTISYTVTANAFVPRSAVISVGNQKFTITQSGGPIPNGGCVYPLPYSTDIVNEAGATRNITIGTNTQGCSWTLTSDANWLLVGPNSGSTSINTAYIIQPNFTSLDRSGHITLRDLSNNQTYTITVSQSKAVLTERQRFVTLAYYSLLGRYPSLAEIQFQDSVLAAGTSRTDFVLSFFNAPEFNLTSRFVAGLYRGILGRDAEYGGWLYQRGALLTGQVNQTQLVSNFLFSQEFQLKYGTLSNSAFVTLMYQQVLGRTPSTDELNFQVNALVQGAVNRVSLAQNFLNSQEFQISNFNRTTAFLLYAGILGRGPSTSEIDFRTYLLQTGTPLRNQISDIVNSLEFQQLTQ